MTDYEGLHDGMERYDERDHAAPLSMEQREAVEWLDYQERMCGGISDDPAADRRVRLVLDALAAATTERGEQVPKQALTDCAASLTSALAALDERTAQLAEAREENDRLMREVAEQKARARPGMSMPGECFVCNSPLDNVTNVHAHYTCCTPGYTPDDERLAEENNTLRREMAEARRVIGDAAEDLERWVATPDIMAYSLADIAAKLRALSAAPGRD